MESYILLDYSTLRVVWWALLGFLLVGFAVMDGFDLGIASALHLVARTDAERRVVINVMAPVWEGNQVWLITGGGAIFAAWPLLYAMAFSGFYLAMMLLLVALILRPVGFKYRSKIEDPGWRASWDAVLAGSGIVAALVFGVAVGNVIQGVPFRFDADTLRPVYEGGFFGLFTPFPLLCGVLSVILLVMHGCVFLRMKTEGAVSARAKSLAQLCAIAVILLFAAAGVWVFHGLDGYAIVGEAARSAASNPLGKEVAVEAGAWAWNFNQWPAMWLAPALGLGGALLVLALGFGPWMRLAFLASVCSVAGVVLTFGFALFPFLLPSSLMPGASLTIWDASASHMSLWVMLIAVLIFMPVVMMYTAWVYRVMSGRVTERSVRETPNAY
ncbi:cytochrome d ubiquinol oxidase subunit II [Paracandidimonas soli]|uniref:Cytochrome bd-I ubiquinol oxidase subunit 2 apoprotein n=1 Tax=Paracandidimonas soli TaxID=1917182 RepID=A0A4V2VSN2_9BURK|nr:cytochrome d ubiquinol oxidase subunit II [Paracandidimonas soli]TCV03050.1 cytochrome bd-I ubiquinol oxidase subunit 2 apoprotein [Paracandidimonas soli]